MKILQKGRSRLNVPQFALLLLLPLLTGCGADRPYDGPTGPPPQAQAKADDAFALDAGTPNGPPDPLIGDSRQTPQDPLTRHDPQSGYDPLLRQGSADDQNTHRGPAMPTPHSHWLRGRLRDARVTVLLNGIRHGTFSGAVDQDITMEMRQGANTVTFEYHPQGQDSTAEMEIVEGEHHPPIAPLVSFHSTPDAVESGDTISAEDLKTVTETFPFEAN